MINVIQKDNLYEIHFKYDPNIISLVKAVPGRRYNPNGKFWTIPLNNLGMLESQFMGTKYENQLKIYSDEHINENATIDKTVDIPDVDISNIDFQLRPECKPYQHQYDFMKFMIDRGRKGNMSGVLLCDEQGLGKATSLDTKIYTPTGYKLMKDIQVGDEVFDENGKVCHVTATYNHDNLNMYKVSFSDGTSINCCEDHLWTFYSHQRKHTWPLKKIISGGKYGPKEGMNDQNRIRNYYLPKIQPVQFKEQDVYLDPWLLGILIGDGSLNFEPIAFTTTYDEILEEVKKVLPEGYKLTKSKITYRIVRKNARPGEYNEVLNYIKELGLDQKSAHKFIPDIYKYNSVENRWKLLQGLMDSDGYAAKGNTHSYSTISLQLANDIIELVQSLGGYAALRKRHAKYYDKDCGICYEVSIKVDDPRLLYKVSKHKKERAYPRHFKARKNFKDIEYIGKMPGKCITVDSANKLYLCEYFIPTHNTVETSMLALYNRKYHGFKHCLIICCMNNTKYHWMEDIEKHTFEKPYILGTRILKSGKNKGKVNYTTGSKEKIADLQTGKMYGDLDGEDLPYFIITNIETLRAKVGKKYVVTELLIDLINNGYINMIAIDEVHKNCSPSSMQGKQILKIKDKTGKKCMWIPMTGTPIVNKPTDVYLPLKLVDGHSYTNYWVWCQTYCIYGGYNDKEIVGYKNIENLKELLQNNMIRRLKEDTLDLPPKLYYTEYVENTKYQEHLYDIVSNELVSERESIVKSLNPLSKIMRLRQVNGSPEIVDEEINYKMDNYITYNAKLQRLLELLDEIHERGEKVLVFSNWVEPLRMIYYHLPKSYHTKCYTGTMKDSDRQEQMKKFKEDPDSMILLGTIDSMGVSHTLTVANNIIFYDEPWTVASFEQCCDRCHRISTTKPVNIYTLITKNTIDEKVDNILYRKKGISSFIVDNIDIHSNPDLFDYLLGE